MSSEHPSGGERLDPTRTAAELASAAERSGRIVQAFWRRQLEAQSGDEFSLVDPRAVGNAFLEWAGAAMTDPVRLASLQMRYWQDQAEVVQSVWRRAAGTDAAPAAEPEKGDRRFKDPAWDEGALHDYLKQSYLVSAKWLRALTRDTRHLSPGAQEKVDFYTRQFVSAVSPSNFAATNPAVLKRAQESGGRNLVDGLERLLEDLERGRGRLKISMTDESAFEVGKNVATAPGKVVYRNELMELIQYAPSTERVHRRPLVIVPPWINKYYILDLQPRNSFVRHAVDEGHTVFVVSWANPGPELADKSFEDYMTLGPLAAVDAVERAVCEKAVNLLGFCIGGILVSATLAWLAKTGGASRVKSATFLTSMFDFGDVGEVSVFIDDAQIAQIERTVAEKGYLDGHHMADMFSMMRENDLIWSFVVNNYLLGREPMAFDLLYWNADSTRLPATMLVYYLKEIYRKNLLKEPGGITLKGEALDLRDVKVPTYLMAAKDDHIAPWRSCYPGTRLFSGERRFVLAASGHVAGVVNPPAARKYGHWTGEALPADPDAWLEGADWHEGSWWPDWYRWLARHAGPKVDAREPGAGGLPAIEDAPGGYVKVRTDAS